MVHGIITIRQLDGMQVGIELSQNLCVVLSTQHIQKPMTDSKST